MSIDASFSRNRGSMLGDRALAESFPAKIW